MNIGIACLRFAAFLSLSLCLLFSNPVFVLGLTKADRDSISRDSVWFDNGAVGGVCSTAPANGTVDSFLQALLVQESGGNPKAENPTTTASGKYQYIDGTWRALAQDLYKPALQYSHASNAPEAVQDAVAYLEYTKKFKLYDGSFFKMAVSHYYPAALEDESKMNVAPSGNGGLTPKEYGDAVVDKMNKGAGSQIALLYLQAPDFEKWLTKLGPVSSGSTNGTTGGCAAGIPAGSFVFYSQYDRRWEDHPYGTSTIGPSGCGPTSVAMIVATFKDKTVTPVEVADFGTSNSAYIPGQGSSHQKMLIEGPENWGLNSESLGTNLTKAIEVLRNGGLVLAAGTGPVPFTDSGHIIVLRGVTDSGKIIVGDPAHESANNKEFTTEELLKSITALYGVTK